MKLANRKKQLSIWGYVLVLLIVTRLLLYTAGFLGVNLFSHYTSQTDYTSITEPYGQTHDVMKLPGTFGETFKITPESLLKFDSLFYIGIVEHGYDHIKIGEPHPSANWVFFPLYPILIAGLSKITSLSTLYSGLLLSNVCLYAALVFIYWIGVERGLSDRQARNVLFFVLLYPSSIYYSLLYTESLFLLLSAASIYFAMRNKYAAAFLVAGLSTVTRVPGIANLLYVTGSLLLFKGFRYSWRDTRYLLYAGLSMVPLLSYFVYMKRLTGDILAPIHEQVNWGRQQSFPFQGYFKYWSDPYFMLGGGWDNGFISFVVSTFVFIVFILAFILQAKTMRKKPEGLLFFLYGAMLITIPFSSSPDYLTSVVRYIMVSLPLYYYLQLLAERWDWQGKVAIVFFTVFQAFITIGYFNDYYFVV